MGSSSSSEEGVEKPFCGRGLRGTTSLPGNWFALAWARQQRGWDHSSDWTDRSRVRSRATIRRAEPGWISNSWSSPGSTG